jgi:flagellar hook assembly protein FlgD
VTPNPFNPRTVLEFTLGEGGNVSVAVYDARGRIVRHLAEGIVMEPGDRSVEWDGLDDDGVAAASGVYHFAVRLAGTEQVVRGVLVR